jgi:alpha-tubulin suppressor-like RCC1 family protein
LGDGKQFTDSDVPVAVVDLPPSAAIAAGFHHTCSLTVAGAVECWGDNASGQLGDTNQGEPKDRPVSVFGLPGTVRVLSAGGHHTCVVLTNGAAMCWGDNRRGQLGDGEAGQDRDFPVAVVGMGSGVAMIDAGAYHTCAATGATGAACWGANESGQLGNGSHATDEDTPQLVVGLGSAVHALTAGGDDSVGFTCAFISQARTHCWGANNYGQLGSGTAGPEAGSDVPVQVARLGSAVQRVDAGGFHACAVTGAGGAWCWGDNRFGQLGDGTDVSRSIPAPAREEVPCYLLTLGYSGGGSAPVAAPTHSAICPAGQYLAGESIALRAQSDPGWRVDGWQGTDDDERTEPANALEMPAADHTVTVSYALEQSAAVYLPAMH